MNLSQLYYFKRLAELQHYTKAAQELNITQPSLSGAIHSLEDELCFDVCGHRIFLAHGHRYGVHGGTWRIVEAAKELGADIAVYGHTHVPDYGKEEGVLVINPGSIAKPRQQGWRKTYAVMTIDDRDGTVDVEFKYLPKRPFF